MTTLLWVHGLGESGNCFAEIAKHPTLAGWSSLSPDLPGYGGASARTRSLAGLADHLAALLTERNATDVTLIGHSMGGVIGTVLAERHPRALARLVNVDGNISSGDCNYSGKIAATDLHGFRSSGRAAMQAYIEDHARTDTAHAGYAPRFALADAGALHRHSGELVAYSAREDLAARMAALAIPTLFVAGSPGGICARSLALLEASGVRTLSIAPAGHWPFVDQPDAFAAAIAHEVQS